MFLRSEESAARTAHARPEPPVPRGGTPLWCGHDHGPERRLGQNKGSRGADGERDPPLAAGALAFDGHDLPQAILGVNDPHARLEVIEVDVAWRRAGDDPPGGTGQVGGRHQPEITRRGGRPRFVAIRRPGPEANVPAKVGPAHAREVADHDRPFGQLREKLRRKRGLLLASKHPHHAPGKIKLAPSPGDADEEEPPLLLDLIVVLGGADVGQDAVLDGDDEHNGKLQPLGGVQRHQRDGPRVFIPPVDRRGQGDLRQEILDRGAGVHLVEFAGGRDQLIEVREAILAVVALVGFQVLAIVDPGQELLHDLLGRPVAQGRQLVHQAGEVFAARGRPCL